MMTEQEIENALCTPKAVQESAEMLEYSVRGFFEAQANGDNAEMKRCARNAQMELGGLYLAAARGVFDCPEVDGPTPRTRMGQGEVAHE